MSTHDPDPLPGHPAEDIGVQQLTDEEFEENLRRQGICFDGRGPRLVSPHIHIDLEDRP